MKTTILIAAALLALPFGAVAADTATNAGSVITMDKEAKVIALEVSNMT